MSPPTSQVVPGHMSVVKTCLLDQARLVCFWGPSYLHVKDFSPLGGFYGEVAFFSNYSALHFLKYWRDLRSWYGEMWRNSRSPTLWKTETLRRWKDRVKFRTALVALTQPYNLSDQRYQMQVIGLTGLFLRMKACENRHGSNKFEFFYLTNALAGGKGYLYNDTQSVLGVEEYLSIQPPC